MVPAKAFHISLDSSLACLVSLSGHQSYFGTIFVYSSILTARRPYTSRQRLTVHWNRLQAGRILQEWKRLLSKQLLFSSPLLSFRLGRYRQLALVQAPVKCAIFTLVANGPTGIRTLHAPHNIIFTERAIYRFV